MRPPPIASYRTALAAALALPLWLAPAGGGPEVAALAQELGEGAAADTALVVAVDVSQSVDEARYRLQIEGIAKALEDPGVIDTILGVPSGGILFTVLAWADRVEVALPWQRIASRDEALAVAAKLRSLRHFSGEFTCLARMLETTLATILPDMPVPARRTVIDVSGDGIDNCEDPGASASARDRLIAAGATVNGLPILVAGESDVVGSGAYRSPGYGLRAMPRGPDTARTTLDAWFRAHVIGGPGSFLLAAQGYADFGRAIRQKFVTEISGTVTPGQRY